MYTKVECYFKKFGFLYFFYLSIGSTETKYFFIHFDRGDKKTEGEKKFSLLKCIQKLNVIKKNLVFSFMYLVSVDPMDRSYLKKV